MLKWRLFSPDKNINLDLNLQVLAWMDQKSALEAELDALSSVLESQGVGMEEPLVDGEGENSKFDI